MSMNNLNEVYRNLIMEDDISGDEIELKFSNNLASEFIRTVNEFTSICAKMVKQRSVSKELYKKYDELNAKIKNLTDAAKNSKC